MPDQHRSHSCLAGSALTGYRYYFPQCQAFLYFFGLMTTSATWMDAPLSSMVIPPDAAAGIAKAGAAAPAAAAGAAAGASSFS